jgi:CheY-like chemotaxis protein
VAQLDLEIRADGDAALGPHDRSVVIENPTRVRILVVDDELLVVRSVARTLRGHVVVAVTSGHEALSLFEAGERFDLILCDLMMPELDGMQLYRAAEQSWPYLVDRFVFMTGGAYSAEGRAFMEARRARQLDKPFNTEAIRACVAQAVRDQSSSR